MISLADRHNPDVSVEILYDGCGLIVKVIGRNGVAHLIKPKNGHDALSIYRHPFVYVDPQDCMDSNVVNRIKGYT